MTTQGLIGFVETEDLLKASEQFGTTQREKLMRDLIRSLRDQVDYNRQRAREYAVLWFGLGISVGIAVSFWMPK